MNTTQHININLLYLLLHMTENMYHWFLDYIFILIIIQAELFRKKLNIYTYMKKKSIFCTLKSVVTNTCPNTNSCHITRKYVM
jgi:hypothetical protein